MRITDKQALERWESFRKDLHTDTALNQELSHAERIKLKAKLESNPIEWMKFIFPKAAYADFAPFQKKAIKRITSNPEWYEVLSWSRELAKTSVTMMCVLYLVLTGKKRNIIFTSSSYDNAENLLEPYRAQLDTNQRIKALYGEQHKLGAWEKGDFKTSGGAAFRAVGAMQSPRGTKNDEIRPDILLIDDFDTDEDCRNPEIIKKKWQWLESALIPTRSISNPLLVVFCGNIIAKDCCITRAGKQADNWDIVNIRDKNGKSTWAEKNTEEMIDIAFRNLTTRAIQQEYYNNPLSEGDIFKEMRWGKVPKLSSFKQIILYGDPSYSNRKAKGTSMKAAFLIGKKDTTFYVLNGYLDLATNAEFIDWIYSLNQWVKHKTQVYNYIENNTLQDPFFQQVLRPLMNKARKEHGYHLPISPDERKKPEKFSRIEGNLEPLNREGNLILNIAEKENPNMQRLEEQFLLLDKNLSAPADGPDCIEGGYFIANYKSTEVKDYMVSMPRSHIINKKRY